MADRAPIRSTRTAPARSEFRFRLPAGRFLALSRNLTEPPCLLGFAGWRVRSGPHAVFPHGDHRQCLWAFWPMCDPRFVVSIRNRPREPLPPVDIADLAALGLLLRASGYQFPAPSAVFTEDNWLRKEITTTQRINGLRSVNARLPSRLC
jgi:hypothetical protein